MTCQWRSISPGFGEYVGTVQLSRSVFTRTRPRPHGPCAPTVTARRLDPEAWPGRAKVPHANAATLPAASERSKSAARGRAAAACEPSFNGARSRRDQERQWHAKHESKRKTRPAGVQRAQPSRCSNTPAGCRSRAPSLAMMLVAVAGITWMTSPYWGATTPRRHAAQRRRVPPRRPAPQQVVADIVSPNRIEIPKLKAQAPIVDGRHDDRRRAGDPAQPEDRRLVEPRREAGRRRRAPRSSPGTSTTPASPARSPHIGKLNPGDDVLRVRHSRTPSKKHEIRFGSPACGPTTRRTCRISRSSTSRASAGSRS